MATTIKNKRPEDCELCYKPDTNGGCTAIDTPACIRIRGQKGVAVSNGNIPFSLVLISFMVQNNPAVVRDLIVNSGIATLTEANSMSAKQMANVLFNYGETNGPVALAGVIKPFTVNTRNVTPAQTKAWVTTTNDLKKALPSLAATANQNQTFDFWSDAIDTATKFIVGGSSSKSQPSVSTITEPGAGTWILYALGTAMVLGIAYFAFRK